MILFKTLKISILYSLFFILNAQLLLADEAINVENNSLVIDEIIVTAEKRTESLQDVSKAVTALGADELETKNIVDFVGLSAIAPGVTVAKNEGYKTIISIRGVGDETNQNAIAAPSVALHMDGIFIASKFSLRTDFIDLERIEVLRGPQGTLFGRSILKQDLITSGINRRLGLNILCIFPMDLLFSDASVSKSRWVCIDSIILIAPSKVTV